jgi:fructose-1,6-bisphosphatase/inositol monophosphatase family enzyme
MTMHTNAKKDAVDLARQAGEIMRTHFGFGIKKEWKDDSTPVTAADKEINALFVRELRSAYPDDDIISEEESDRREGAEYTWACDPLDGTIPFSLGIPTSVSSLALCKDGDPIVGVIYDPFMDRMFVAEKGKGATMNDTPIHVSAASLLENAAMNMGMRLAMSMDLVGGKGAKKISLDLSALRTILGKKQLTKCFSLGCVMYTGTLVARGELVATIFSGTGCHDGASLKIIVEEAGGKVTDILGREQRYDQPINGLLVSNGAIHDQLIDMVQEAIAQNI